MTPETIAEMQVLAVAFHDREATITINGVALTMAQASAIRIAVTGMRWGIGDPETMAGLGPIGPAYAARLSEVEDIILRLRTEP